MKQVKGYLILMFGVMALSSSAIFVRLAGAPAAVTAFYRLLFALVVLWPAALLQPACRRELRTLTLRQVLATLGSGLLLAVHFVLWFESLRFTSVASSTVLVALQPLFAIALSYAVLRERQRPLALLGCLIAIFGSCIIGFGDFKAGPNALLGDALALAAAALMGAYFFVGQILRKEISATVYTALGYTGSCSFLLIYGLCRGDAFFGYAPQVWGCFLGLALLATLLGQFLFNHLLRWLSAATISTGVLGEPVGTCILAHFLLHETIGPQQLLGMIVILGGLLLYFLSPKQNS